jgi:hypothetical protein
MSYNILDVIKDEILGEALHVDQQTYIDRVSICMQCEHHKNIIPMTRR